MSNSFILQARVPESVMASLYGYMDDDQYPHITIVYFGEPTSVSESDRGRIFSEICDALLDEPEFGASISGFGRFITSDGVNPTVALVGSISLTEFRHSLVERFRKSGLPFYNTYAYTPHITLSRSKPIPELDEVVPFSISNVDLVCGSEAESFNLVDSSKVRSGLKGNGWYVANQQDGNTHFVTVGAMRRNLAQMPATSFFSLEEERETAQKMSGGGYLFQAIDGYDVLLYHMGRLDKHGDVAGRFLTVEQMRLHLADLSPDSFFSMPSNSELAKSISLGGDRALVLDKLGGLEVWNRNPA